MSWLDRAWRRTPASFLLSNCARFHSVSRRTASRAARSPDPAGRFSGGPRCGDRCLLSPPVGRRLRQRGVSASEGARAIRPRGSCTRSDLGFHDLGFLATRRFAPRLGGRAPTDNLARRNRRFCLPGSNDRAGPRRILRGSRQRGKSGCRFLENDRLRPADINRRSSRNSSSVERLALSRWYTDNWQFTSD